MEAEESLLSCCLLDEGHSLAVCDDRGLTPGSFYDPANRTMYEVLCDMRNTGKPIDEVVFTEELERRKLLHPCGGIIRINAITNRIPTTAHLSYFIEQVKNLEGLRAIVDASVRAIEGCYSSQGDIASLAATVEQGVLAATRGIESKLPPMRDATEIFKKPHTLPPEVIKGVLHRTCKLLISGQSKARKTWTLINLAVAVATGSEWLGMQCTKGKVCYINFEIHEGFFDSRLKQVASAMGVSLEPGMLSVWNLRSECDDIAKLRPAILARLIGQEYSLIIVDPVYKVLGDRDENNAGDMTALLNEFQKIFIKTGAAGAFGAHFAKGSAAGKSAIDRAAGSGVLARDPDAVMTMTEHEEDDCLTIDMVLRNAPPKPSFSVRWEAPLFHVDESLDPKALKGLDKEKEKPTPERHNSRRSNYGMPEIASYFPGSADEPSGLQEVQRAARDGTMITQNAFLKMRGDLIEAGWIVQLDDSRWGRTKLGDQFVFDWKNRQQLST